MVKKKFDNKKAIMSSFVVAALLLVAISAFQFIIYNNSLDYKRSGVEHKYLLFENRINTINNNNIAIIYAFNAYLSSVDSLDENNTLELLETLLSNKDNNIRNIKVYKGITKYWDLSPNNDYVEFLNPNDQIAYINQLNNTQNSILQGPFLTEDDVNTFLVRTAINRDDVYWGQTSVIINADDIAKLIENFEEEFEIKVQILNVDALGNKFNTIYSGQFIHDKRDLEFHIKTDIIDWLIFIQPSNGWQEQRHWLIIFPFLGLLLSIFTAYKYYAFITKIAFTNSKVNHDHLTDLYNRPYLEKYFNRVIGVATLNKLNVGLILINIDKFKETNEKYGYRIGELVLIQIAKKLKTLLRHKQEVFRIGGDEFLFVIENVDTIEILQEIKDRLIEAVSENISVENIILNVTASAGTAYYPEDGSDLETLLENAYDSRYKGDSTF